MGRRWATPVLLSVLSLVSVAWAASTAAAQTATGPRLIEPEAIAFDDAPDTVEVQIANGEAAGPIHALLTGDISESAGLATSEPSEPCPEVDTLPLDDLEPGGLVTFWVGLCEGPEEAASGSLIVWGASGDLIKVPVSYEGAAAPDAAPALGAPKKIPLQAKVGPAFTRIECLPKETAEQSVPLSGDDGFLVLSVTPKEEDTADAEEDTVSDQEKDGEADTEADQEKDETCTAGAAFELSIDDLDDAGTFTGTLDVNGDADGGEAETTLNVRKSIWCFLLYVLGGSFVAAVLALLPPIRQRRQLRDGRRFLRLRVVAGQEQCLNKLEAVFGKRPATWTVVSPTDVRPPPLAFDKELARLDPPAGSMPAEVPAELLPMGGEVYKEVDKSSRLFVEDLERASALAKKYKVLLEAKPKESPPDGGPTLSEIRLLMTDDEPPINEKDLSDLLAKICPVIEGLKSMQRKLSALAEIKETKERAKTLMARLYSEDLMSEDARTQFEGEIDTLRKDVGEAVGIGDEATETPPPSYQRGPRWRQVALTELFFAVLSFAAALAVAWATLYANDPAWGTDADIAAAATWALGVGAAVQVARHVNLGRGTSSG